jgi:hypothetical protein
MQSGPQQRWDIDSQKHLSITPDSVQTFASRPPDSH